MAKSKSFLWVVFSKTVLGAMVGTVVLVLAKLMHFPPVFQVMFALYVLLGTAVFILLDAPPLPPVGGFKAVVALVGFYAVISVAFIAGANVLPQYDPMVEKGKIDKIVKPKLAATEKGKFDELLKRSEELAARSEAIMSQLQALGKGGQVAVAKAPTGETAAPRAPAAAAGDLIALGKEQYDLQECYNCHKIGGKGSVKKRGPVLDNIGNLMTPEQLKEKILNPKSWLAEGFEKEYEKGLMPDKYKELMQDQEIDALVAYLASLKDPSIETPKPIKKM